MEDKPKIIFEDESLFVINKPAGFITNEADTTTNQPVVQTWIKTNFKYPIADSWELRSGVVHRLDKETSGILLIAKTIASFIDLQNQFKERVIQKSYLALVHGDVMPSQSEINAPVGRLPWRRDRFGVLPGGREAVTLYKVNSRYQNLKSGEKYSFMELFPKTGRTHQIRIHLKHIGHPIVSDDFYVGRKTARRDRIWCPRLFLHAYSISFLHPSTKKNVTYNCQLAGDLRGSLDTLTLTTPKNT